ncbi:MAG: phasin family protein [Betaproteobacteria bacterium]|nr:phasin family protein [Betaproteobacteria bacterium]
MAEPTDSTTAWQKAALDATVAYAQASLAGVEQLLKLNIENAKSALEQNAQTARELLSINDPHQLAAMRTKLAQASMVRNASYAQTIAEVVNQTQTHLAKLAENQIAQAGDDLLKGAEAAAKTIPGSQIGVEALKSSMAASSAMLENLNRVAIQFQELSDASIRAATANMVRGAGDK